MKSYVFLPPLKKATGGSRALVDLARHVRAAGFPACVVSRGPATETSMQDMEVLDWADLALTPEDIWVVPEGWPNALVPGLTAGSRCLAYVQNHAYLFSALPPEASWGALPVRFLAVSQPVAWHIRQVLGADSLIVRSAIDLTVFGPGNVSRRDPACGPLTVAYMPRKNKAMAERVREITQARGLVLRWEAIEGLGPRQVAEVLNRAHVFLAAGFPEGLGLPPLEAMACGCVVVGCGGLGGFDYMRQAADFPGAYTPWCPLRDVPWEGNGLWVADGDFLAAATAVEHAATLWRAGGSDLQSLVANGRKTAQAYGQDNMAAEAAAAWSALAGG